MFRQSSDKTGSVSPVFYQYLAERVAVFLSSDQRQSAYAELEAANSDDFKRLFEKYSAEISDVLNLNRYANGGNCLSKYRFYSAVQYTYFSDADADEMNRYLKLVNSVRETTGQHESKLAVSLYVADLITEHTLSDDALIKLVTSSDAVAQLQHYVISHADSVSRTTNFLHTNQIRSIAASAQDTHAAGAASARRPHRVGKR